MVDIISLSGLIYAVGKDAWFSYAKEKEYKQEKRVVNLNYPTDSGIKDAWENKGYNLCWILPRDVETKKLQGFEIIYAIDDQKKEIFYLECWNEGGRNNLVYMGKKIMKLYKLTPNPMQIEDPLWTLSSTKEELIIRAATDERARELASIAAYEAGGTVSTNRHSPWRDTSLTNCEIYLGTEHPTEGEEKILQPALLDRELPH